MLRLSWRLSVLNAEPGAFLLRQEWTSMWKHRMSLISWDLSNPLWCALCFEYSVYFLSLHQWDKSICSLCHHHSSFPSAPSPNCKHSLTSCLRLWSLTPVSYVRWSPTDVSVAQSPPGCFLAEWRRSLRVSSGDRAWPDPGHLLGESLALQHSTEKTQLSVGHLFSTLVNMQTACQPGRTKTKWYCRESKYTLH